METRFADVCYFGFKSLLDDSCSLLLYLNIRAGLLMSLGNSITCHIVNIAFIFCLPIMFLLH